MILFSLYSDQNESLPFNNTLLYSNNNQSYFTQTVPSTYYCWQVLDDLVFLTFTQSSPLLNVFACLVLADEDQSIVDTFRVSDIPGNLIHHLLMHIDVLMLYRKFELIPTKTFQVMTI